MKRNIYEPNSTNGLELVEKQQQQTNYHESMLDCKCFTTCITKLFQFCFGRIFIQVDVVGERKRKQQNQLDAILKSSEMRSQITK